MEKNFDWKNSPISIKKSEIPKEGTDLFFNDLPREFIKENRKLLKESSFVKEKRGIFSVPDFEKKFAINGSYKVSNLDDLGNSLAFFKQREGRIYEKKSNTTTEYFLRGPRYICALDPNISVRQKLKILSEDAFEAIEFIRNEPLAEKNQFNTIAPLLDYIKNTSIAILNAYIYDEKLGIDKSGDKSYQEKRSKLIELVAKSSFNHYLSLIDSLEKNDLNYLLQEDTNTLINEACTEITKSFEKKEFPNDALARPEASHPLVTMGATELIMSTHPEIDTIVGMPSGATEISCVLIEAYKKFLNKNNELILLSISNHTINNLQKKDHIKPISFSEFISKEKSKLDKKNVLVIDDNSSTGGTLEKARKAIMHVSEPHDIIFTVLEADIIRSQIDKDSKKRENLVNPLLYKLSVSVLPISKILSPKVDLKEIMETKELIEFYKQKIKEAANPSEKIKYEIFLDDLENPTEKKLKEIPKENIIEKFQGTYLSNFYAVPVIHDNITYPSVEHAYQAAKFDPSIFSSLDAEQKASLSEILKEKGYAKHIEDFGAMFMDPTIPSGITKSIANKLREWKMVRPDWDDMRLEIMINLLIQKFNDPELKEKLKNTKDTYLIEGNDWADTLWGVCDGKGKNMLGRAIMNIRGKIE